MNARSYEQANSRHLWQANPSSATPHVPHAEIIWTRWFEMDFVSRRAQFVAQRLRSQRSVRQLCSECSWQVCCERIARC